MVDKKYCMEKLVEIGDRLLKLYEETDSRGRREIRSIIYDNMRIDALFLSREILVMGIASGKICEKVACEIKILDTILNYVSINLFTKKKDYKPLEEACKQFTRIKKEIFDEIIDEINNGIIRAIEEIIE